MLTNTSHIVNQSLMLNIIDPRSMVPINSNDIPVGPIPQFILTTAIVWSPKNTWNFSTKAWFPLGLFDLKDMGLCAGWISEKNASDEMKKRMKTWPCPEMGVPLVLIHSSRIFPFTKTIQLLGYPHFRKSPHGNKHFRLPKNVHRLGGACSTW